MAVRIRCCRRNANDAVLPFGVSIRFPLTLIVHNVHLESLSKTFFNRFCTLRFGAAVPDKDAGAYAAEEGGRDEDTGGPSWALKSSSKKKVGQEIERKAPAEEILEGKK